MFYANPTRGKVYAPHLLFTKSAVEMHMCAWDSVLWFQAVVIAEYPRLVIIGIIRKGVGIATLLYCYLTGLNASLLAEVQVTVGFQLKRKQIVILVPRDYEDITMDGGYDT